MFDNSPVTASVVADWVARLARSGHRGTGLDDPGLVDLLRQLERLSCAAAGLQAVAAVELDTSQRAAHAAAGVPRDRQGRGVAAQIGLARRESPHRGARHLALATSLQREMPRTLAALVEGRITEWRATLLARETACLSRDDRVLVDEILAGDPETLEGLSDRQLVAEAAKLAYHLDPASLVNRRRSAEGDRRVTGRPAPDTMMRLSALLPVAAGVGVIAALTRQADALRAAGDPRTRGQIMADTLVERVTGVTGAIAAAGPVMPVAVGLVVSDTVLLGGAEGPAHLEGHGPIPADLARELVHGNLDRGTRVWLRRLYQRPGTEELVAMDSHARLFRDGLRHLVRLRDQVCRTPWCDAPIRHADHVEAAEDDGHTSAANAQGLCEACNYTKQAPGWHAQPRPGPRHTVETTTPTGHTYVSTAPPLGPQALVDLDWFRRVVRVRARWADLVRAA